MALGYISFAMVHEPKKEDIPLKENSFKKFLGNSWVILREDKDLQIQLSTFLFAYGYLLALPFIILHAKETIHLDGVAIGSLITTQMIGAMLSNFLWGSLSGRGYNKLTSIISILLHICAIALAFFSTNIYSYMIIFFLIGAATDGNRIASGNLILILAPPKLRPTYVALQVNIISFGIFFSVLGGAILHFSNYTALYSITIATLLLSLFLSFKLKD